MSTEGISGMQRPRPPGAAALGHNRSLSRTGSFANPSPIGSSTKQVLIDLTDGDETDRGQDHPAKRLKLDAAAERTNTPDSGNGGDDEGRAMTHTPLFDIRKQPAWSFEESFPQNMRAKDKAATVVEQKKGSGSTRPLSPPPLPIRPWKFGPRSGKDDEMMKSREAVRSVDVQTTPYVLDVPPCAPRYQQDKPADFFPWVGEHPEDVLNEQTTKTGHYDRVQLSQNETNTARPSLYSMFKNKSNLQVLSSLFVSALEQRQAHGKITSNSTFKPPPRVTLTDTKRETWLRDLANPSVPLRKLSRTIPHGIRGRSLLEQCLGKSIPVSRAIWLAKCVGANEIRAFKRKGTNSTFAVGGEAKWVREWTICVEQFVDVIVASCGEPRWKGKVAYASGLSARLYNEQLLDRDHYLGWILASLDTCPLERLPIWLSLLQIYRDDLMQFRKTGRHLATILLTKRRQIDDCNAHDIFKPVVQRLTQLIRHLALSYPGCFIIPDLWMEIRDTLSNCLNQHDPQQNATLRLLAVRNECVGLKPRSCGGDRALSPRERLISLLDNAKAPYDVAKTSTEALAILDERFWLVRTTVEWSSTSFRAGKSRTYLAVRLLRLWHKKGVDVDGPICEILADSTNRRDLSSNLLFHLIAELVRSQTFTVGKYLQWLMARGAFNQSPSKPDGSEESMNTPLIKLENRWDIHLLKEFPRLRIPQHIWNLRNTLLARAGLAHTEEEDTIALFKARISLLLPQIFPTTSDVKASEDVDIRRLRNATWSVKSDIGQWIRKHVSSYYKPAVLAHIEDKINAAGLEASALTTEEFLTIRGILENLGDISMLADILSDACSAEDATVLASAADTISYNFASLAAIGAHNNLYKSLLEGYRQMSSAGLPTNRLIVSLIRLGKRMPNEAVIVSHLRQELGRSVQSNAIAACSPVSDDMSGNLQFSDVNFLEEFEQFLGTGNRMDEDMMLKSFRALTQRLLVSEDVNSNQIARLNNLLSQLRPYNEKQFDALMIKWVTTLVKENNKHLEECIPPLIGTGCLTFEALVSISKSALESHHDSAPGFPGPRSQLCHIVVSEHKSDSISLDADLYRFRLAQQDYHANCPNDVLDVLREATIESIEQSSAMNLSPLQSVTTADILRHYVVRHTDLVANRLLHPLSTHSDKSKAILERGINLLLNSNIYGDPITIYADTARDAIGLLNDFSLPFCKVKLELELARGEIGNDAAFCDMMYETAKSNARAGMSHWIEVVSMLDVRVAQFVREKAEESFMTTTSSEGIFDLSQDDSPASKEQEARLSLDIIEKLSSSIPDTGVPTIGPFLLDRLNCLLSKSSTSSNLEAPNTPNACPLQTWFHHLLRLSLLHRATFTRGKPTASIDLARLLLAITSLATTTPFCSLVNLQTFAFDTAATLSDDLSDESRHQTARFLREKSRDPRMTFLFGFREEEGDKLQLSQRGRLWPYPLRQWELLEEPTPIVGVNDTAVSLTLFQARRV